MRSPARGACALSGLWHGREVMQHAGENLTAVWYRKVSAAAVAESWETRAFEEQDQSKAIRAVKDAPSAPALTAVQWALRSSHPSSRARR